MAEPINRLICLRCGHAWYPRSPQRPRFCAKCNSPYWDKPYQMTRKKEK